LQSTVSLALPLVLVSLTGQFLPGLAILRVSGYQTPARPVLMITGAVSMVVALFGGITVVIAAITAALCTGADAHRDPNKRYIAGIANGFFYLLGGIFCGDSRFAFCCASQRLRCGARRASHCSARRYRT